MIISCKRLSLFSLLRNNSSHTLKNNNKCLSIDFQVKGWRRTYIAMYCRFLLVSHLFLEEIEKTYVFIMIEKYILWATLRVYFMKLVLSTCESQFHFCRQWIPQFPYSSLLWNTHYSMPSCIHRHAKFSYCMPIIVPIHDTKIGWRMTAAS